MDPRSFIDGQLAGAHGSRRGLTDPATGSSSGHAFDATIGDVDDAVASSAAAMGGDWARSTPGERATVLLDLARAVSDAADELTELEVADTGKPVATVRDGELPFAVDNLRYFAGIARSLEGTGAGELSRGYLSVLTRRPVGVVAAVAPWNFPLVMAVWKAVPPLAAGCTVVLKPAPATPRTAVRLGQLAHAAGLPAGVLNVVVGGDDVGAHLTSHPDVAMITLTGSTRTGRRVMAAAAPTVKRLHLELGGKAPVVVLDDADLTAMADAVALGATYNTGQDCTAATRVYAPRERLDDVVEALAARLSAVRAGPPAEPDTDIGPLISAAHRERVHGHVADARAAGAAIVVGGQTDGRDGWWYPPTLLRGVEQRAPIVQDEVFGPVLVALPYDDVDQAVALANDVRYGLAASLWTRDVGRALAVADAIDAGAVWVNDHLPLASEAPHGGLKQSGFGTDLGADAVAAFSVQRHLMVRRQDPPDTRGHRPA